MASCLPVWSGGCVNLILAVLLGASLLLLVDVPLAGEVLGIGLPLLGLIAAGVGIARHRTRRDVAAGCAAVALAAVAGTILPWTPTDHVVPTSGTTVAVANLSASNDGEQAAALLNRSRPDVLVTAETPVLALVALADGYPHTLAAGRALGGTNIYSVHPLRRLPQPAGLGRVKLVVVAVDAPQPFTLVAAHLPRPWWRTQGLVDMPETPRYQASLVDQRDTVTALVEALARIDGPVVLAGDLNLADRGWGYRRITGLLDDPMRSSWTSPTSIKGVFLPLRLRIDHILVGGGLCGGALPRLPLAGSDHVGIQAQVGAC